MKSLIQTLLPLFSIFLALFLMKLTFAQTVVRIDPKKAYDNFSNGKAIFLDVREQDEIDFGKIKDTKIIPMSLMTKDIKKFEQEITHLPKDKEINIYCRSGRRSGIVGIYLKSKGYNVKNLGGYSDWEKLGLPIEKKGED